MGRGGSCIRHGLIVTAVIAAFGDDLLQKSRIDSGRQVSLSEEGELLWPQVSVFDLSFDLVWINFAPHRVDQIQQFRRDVRAPRWLLSGVLVFVRVKHDVLDDVPCESIEVLLPTFLFPLGQLVRMLPKEGVTKEVRFLCVHFRATV